MQSVLLQPSSGSIPQHQAPTHTPATPVHLSFEEYIKGMTRTTAPAPKGPAIPPANQAMSGSSAPAQPRTLSNIVRNHAYTQATEPQNLPPVSDWEKYKEDQLLSNPGGETYRPGQQAPGDKADSSDSFLGNIARDIGDALANVKNFFQDLFFGSTFHYKKPDGTVAAGKKKGILGSVIDLVKDVGSALTLGMWRPDGEKEPQGLGERFQFAWKKLKEAVGDDLFGGVAAGVNNAGEDLLLAGLNLVEAVPDATIGMTEMGRKATTAVFDNGQVAVDYLTDVLPGGEAWMRVHTFSLDNGKFPVAYNVKMPENYQGDVRWQYIRNTPLRKIIETLGAGIADALTLKLVGQLSSSGDSSSKVQSVADTQ